MHTVYLALGSNVGDRTEHLARAASLLGEGVSIERRAPIYESKPVGKTDQPNFYNTVIEARTDMSPRDLLAFIKKVEGEVGRTPSEHWGPREIDIDIIFYDDLILQEPDLTIPHPHTEKRDFVLAPLADIAPDMVHPALRKTVSELLAELPRDKKSIMAKVAI